LAELISKNCSDKLKRRLQLPYPITMSKEEFLAVDIFDTITIHYLHTQFIGDVVIDPDIMVTDKPNNANAAIGKFGKFSEETNITARHDIAILIPIVENIAKKIDNISILLNRIEEIHNSFFRLMGILEIRGSEMEIA
jgi:hypothetical protein